MINRKLSCIKLKYRGFLIVITTSYLIFMEETDLDSSQGKRLTSAAIIVMSSIIVSRVTGFLRTVLINNLLHKTMEKDALFMSFTITDLLYSMLVGGSIAAALIPVLSGYLARNEEEGGWKIVSSFINMIFIAISFLALIGIVFSPQIVHAIAPGFDEEKASLTIKLTRILFPSVSFIMLAGLSNGILNSYKRFAAAAYGPSLYNMGSVCSIFLLNKYGVDKVAMGIMVSAILYFLFQLSFLLEYMKYYRFKIYFQHSGFIKLFKLAIPSLIASSIVQINVMISQSYSSNFPDGSVTALRNATDIWYLPYGIFAMGMGMAILPTLSGKLALKEVNSFKTILNKSIKTVLILIIPSGVGLIVLGTPIISAIYKWSAKIDVYTISLTYKILVFFTIALLMQSIVAIVNRAFYANNDTKTPLFVGTSTIVVNAGLCFLFFNLTTLQASGMALAYSISSAIYAIVLLLILDRRMDGLSLHKLIIFLVKVFFASFVMGVVLYFVNRAIPVDVTGTYSIGTKIVELAYLLMELAVGIVVYFLIVIVMKIEEAIYVYKVFTGRLRGMFRTFFRIS